MSYTLIEYRLLKIYPHSVVISDEEGRRNRIAFNSLYLFSFRSIIYKANGENCMISRVEKNLSALLPQSCVQVLLRLSPSRCPFKNVMEAWPP